MIVNVFRPNFPLKSRPFYMGVNLPPPPPPPPRSSLRITQLRRDNKSLGTSLEADRCQAQESSEFPDRVE